MFLLYAVSFTAAFYSTNQVYSLANLVLRSHSIFHRHYPKYSSSRSSLKHIHPCSSKTLMVCGTVPLSLSSLGTIRMKVSSSTVDTQSSFLSLGSPCTARDKALSFNIQTEALSSSPLIPQTPLHSNLCSRESKYGLRTLGHESQTSRYSYHLSKERVTFCRAFWAHENWIREWPE